MSVTARVILHREHIQKLGARAVCAQALRIEGFSGESVSGKVNLKMPAVSNVDAPGSQAWCVSRETSLLWS